MCEFYDKRVPLNEMKNDLASWSFAIYNDLNAHYHVK